MKRSMEENHLTPPDRNILPHRWDKHAAAQRLFDI